MYYIQNSLKSKVIWQLPPQPIPGVFVRQEPKAKARTVLKRGGTWRNSFTASLVSHPLWQRQWTIWQPPPAAAQWASSLLPTHWPQFNLCQLYGLKWISNKQATSENFISSTNKIPFLGIDWALNSCDNMHHFYYCQTISYHPHFSNEWC